MSWATTLAAWWPSRLLMSTFAERDHEGCRAGRRVLSCVQRSVGADDRGALGASAIVGRGGGSLVGLIRLSLLTLEPTDVNRRTRLVHVRVDQPGHSELTAEAVVRMFAEKLVEATSTCRLGCGAGSATRRHFGRESPRLRSC
jgi:hypothetical protein